MGDGVGRAVVDKRNVGVIGGREEGGNEGGDEGGV